MYLQLINMEIVMVFYISTELSNLCHYFSSFFVFVHASPHQSSDFRWKDYRPLVFKLFLQSSFLAAAFWETEI